METSKESMGPVFVSPTYNVLGSTPTVDSEGHVTEIHTTVTSKATGPREMILRSEGHGNF